MKKLYVFALLAFCTTALSAQVASSECIEEVTKAYAQIDHEAMLATDNVTLLKYRHTYIMKTDPKGEKVSGDEHRM
ncbi:MAG: hypothetical protein AAF570_22540, partial [Bacteroidota bacterium]